MRNSQRSAKPHRWARWAILLAVLAVMALGCAGALSVLADTQPAAKIGSTEYDTVDQAIAAAAKDGADTIELQKGASPEQLKITKAFDKNITFTGTGTVTMDVYAWYYNHTLTLDGENVNFNITSSKDAFNALPGENQRWLMICLGGTINVKNGASMDLSFDSDNGVNDAFYMSENAKTDVKINVENGSHFSVHGKNTKGKPGQGVQLGKTANSGIYVKNNSTFLIEGTNRGYVNSPVVNVEDSEFTVRNCTNNGSNGGRFIATNAKITFENNAVLGLSADEVTSKNSTFHLSHNGNAGLSINKADGKSTFDSTSKVYINNNGQTTYGAFLAASNVTFEKGSLLEVKDNKSTGVKVLKGRISWVGSEKTNGKLIFEDGADVTVMNNSATLTSEVSRKLGENSGNSYGGGFWVSGTLQLNDTVKIYNNHALSAGDDIYVEPKGTIEFSSVGSDWELNKGSNFKVRTDSSHEFTGDDCSDHIDGWYDDSSSSRWDAHKEKDAHIEKIKPGKYYKPLAIKAAHGISSTPGNNSTDWTVSKSKIATNLAKDHTSDVTLSLPSSEEQLVSEVAFVLDESSFSDTRAKALELLSTLKNHVDSTGAKVQVDIIGFKRAAYNHGSYDLRTEYDTIEKAFNKQYSGGSNMHAGLLMAKEILAKNTNIPNNRKYMVLVSDGDTYLYCKDGDYNVPYSRSYIPVDKAGGAYAYGGFYDESYYKPSEPYAENAGRPSSGNTEKWETYLNDVEKRNNESNGDSYDYVWKYYDEWAGKTLTAENPDGFKTQPREVRSASNMDMAFLYASKTYQELAGKYNCYSVAVQSLNTDDGGHKAFMDYLNGGKTADFATIQNEILYFLGAGSTVEDYMGYQDGDYNFDLTDPSEMTLSLEDTKDGKTSTYAAAKIADNHYGFKKNGSSDASSYDYEVIYVPGDKKSDEHFIWKINVPVSNFTHVKLHYTVQLMNPKSKPGTYGEYDRDGSAGKTGLFTNTKAILHPVNSNGEKGKDEVFPKPTVSYTVKAPNPSGRNNRTIKVIKKWVTDDGGTPAKSVKIEILKDGSKYRIVNLSDSNHWTWSESVPGNNAKYTAKELTKVTGFRSSYSISKSGNTITITNNDVKSDNDGPKTGDSSHIFLYGSIGILAAALLSILLWRKHRITK